MFTILKLAATGCYAYTKDKIICDGVTTKNLSRDIF